MDHHERFPTNLASLATGRYVPDPGIFRCRSDRTRNPLERLDDLTADTADTLCSYNLVCRDTDGENLGSSCLPTTMLACDKDGANGNVTDAGFGGNHAGDGGNVLRADGAVLWVREDEWQESTWGEADPNSVVGY
jgi:hypothetical protein